MFSTLEMVGVGDTEADRYGLIMDGTLAARDEARLVLA